MLDLFEEAQERNDGWWEYRFKAYDASALPKGTAGPLKDWGPAKYVTKYHGFKMEALYAILAEIYEPRGGLRSSGDKTEFGQRFNQGKGGDVVGVYCHDGSYKHGSSATRGMPLSWETVLT